MTISITRTGSTNGSYSRVKEMSSRVYPADVWDLDRSRPGRGKSVNVRTLEQTSRKYDPLRRSSSEGVEAVGNEFETGREKTGAALMGALFGVALIIGSAFGGAFSGGDAGFVPESTGHQIAAVPQR